MKGPKVPRQSTCSVFRTSWSEIAWTLNGEQNQFNFLADFSIISFLFSFRIEFCVIATEIERSRILILSYFGNTLNWICSSYQTEIISGPARLRLLRVRRFVGMKSYEDIYSPYVFVSLKPSLLPSISVLFQEQNSSPHVFTWRQVRCFDAKCQKM